MRVAIAESYAHLDSLRLREIFDAGVTPSWEDLNHWEFAGINLHPALQTLGFSKFIKGFFTDTDGQKMGYNMDIDKSQAAGIWKAQGVAYGFYEVESPPKSGPDARHPHALFLDYSKGRCGPYLKRPPLRDYLIQPDPKNLNVFLGVAYFAIGSWRIGPGAFVLVRIGRARLLC